MKRDFAGCLLIVMAIVSFSTMAATLRDRIFSTINTKHGLSDNQVLHLLQLPDGRMVISTLGNINIYDATGFDYVHYDSSTRYPLPNYEGHQHVYVSDGNLLWSKSRGSVQCFSLNSNSYISNVDSILSAMKGDTKPLDLFVDRDGALWTVSEQGILDTRHKKRLPLLSDRLQDVETKGDTAMLFYDTGVMEGFDRNSGKRLWHTAAYPDSEAYTSTSLVRVTPDGNVLQVRVSDAGESILLRFDTSSLKWDRLLTTPYVLHTLAVPNSKEVYIASMRGLWCIDLTTGDSHLIDRLKGFVEDISLARGFNTLFIDNAGGCWIGTYGSGLLYSPSDPTPVLSRPNLKALGVDTLLIKRVELKDAKSLVDKEGRVWTATVDGLRIYNPLDGHDTTLYVEDGLSNNCIKSLALAPDGVMWASTANGINAIHTTAQHNFHVEAYNNENGTFLGEYAEGPSYITSTGEPLFFHPSGWTLINPTSTGLRRVAPTPLVRQITVNGSPVSFDADKNIEFSYDENDITIDFSSLNFANPNSTVWQYRTLTNGLGNDTLWYTYNGTGGAFHFTLPRQMPGHYRIQVRSAVCADAPFSTPAEVRFTIRRPWWGTGWALAGYIILLLSLCSIGWYIYRRIERKRIEKRHNEEKMLLRMTELIDRCNYYEAKIKEAAENVAAKGSGVEVAEKKDVSESSQPEMSQEDKDFIARAINLMEINMDKGYTVEKLSSDLCMERTGLYKRLTALLDKSPSAFIKSIRLNHVVRLIEEGKLSMNEIAELTGFSSSSHMSRCFKEERGCTPTEYSRRLTAQENV